MARSKGSKVAILNQLEDRVKRSKSIVFANLQGLKVKESEELRKACRAEGSECVMAKKTLFQRVLKTADIEINARKFEGEVAAIFGYADEIAPAKILALFGKTHESLKILGGVMMSAPVESRILDAVTVHTLAKLPSRDELRAKLVGTLANPMRGLVTVLQGNLRGLVQVLHAASQK